MTTRLIAAPLTVLLQDVICRGAGAAEGFLAAGCEVIRFAASGDWRATLRSVDRALGPAAGRSGSRIACFVSLDAARFIRRECPALARGLLLDEDKLRVQAWSGILPASMQLNRGFILLPFGQLAQRRRQLEALFGDAFFIRPDSAMKTFAGTPVSAENFEAEVNALRQIHKLHGDELVVIDRGREIGPVEWRFWLADGGIVTHAPYSFTGAVPGDMPEGLMDLAREAAARLEGWCNPVVADFTLEIGRGPRLVELNALSTSGIYPGADTTAIARLLDNLFIASDTLPASEALPCMFCSS